MTANKLGVVVVVVAAGVVNLLRQYLPVVNQNAFLIALESIQGVAQIAVY